MLEVGSHAVVSHEAFAHDKAVGLLFCDAVMVSSAHSHRSGQSGSRRQPGIPSFHKSTIYKVLITAQEQNQKVDSLYEHIVEFDKKRTETLTAYRNDIVKIVNVTDIFRIYTGNQKVYIQTNKGEYVIRYRLYELDETLDKKQFLRISNSEIVNVKKIRDIDLSIIGKICIRFEDNTQTYVSRRYIPKIKKCLGI